jgi:hypothetical protein
MSNYTKSTNFTAKDSLPTGDTNKVIRGSEFDTEFNAIQTAVGTKADLAGPTFTGTATFDGITATGTVNFTGGSVTTNIDGGTIDGVTIGGTTAGAGTFSSLTATTADINAGTVDNTVIGGSTPAAGTFSSLTATTANIDGGNIDGTVIGASSTAAISGTTGTFSGAVTGSNLNVANWDTAYGWGDHGVEGYLTSVTFSDIDAGAVTLSTETFANSDTQIPTNAAVRNWVLTTYPTIVEQNNLTLNVTWATVPDAYISESSVTQHEAALSISTSQLAGGLSLSDITDVTATASEVNTLDGITATTAELNYTDGVTSNIQTQLDSKVGTSHTGDVDITGELLVDSYNETFKKVSSVGVVTPYQLSSAAYASKSFSVTSQETAPRAVEFKTDGTKMYVVGSTSDTVFQYSLSTAWDVSTASYDSKSFSVASEQTVPDGIRFKPDGTKFYIIGDTPDSVHQYSMSTAWDISTASYDSVTFSVSSQLSQSTALFFKPDGLTFYAVGAVNDTVYQYTLSTAWDLSSASYASKSFSVASQATFPTDVNFNDDGTKMFVQCLNTDFVYQYSLSTAWDVSTASYDSVSFSTGSQEVNPYGCTFGDSGTKMYVVGNSGDTVYQYSTAVTTYSTTFDCENANVFETELDANTTVVFSNPPASGTPVATGYGNASGWSYESKSFSVSSQDTVPADLIFNNDGTKMYIIGDTNNSIFQYSLSTAYDISTASYDSVSFSIAGQETAPTGLAFNDDGTSMYIIGYTDDRVEQYTLSTAYDLSTASYASKSFLVSSQEATARAVTFNNNGTSMYIVGTTNDTVYQYTLSTAFDVSTASYASKSFSVATQAAGPTSVIFNSSGTKMYIGNTIDENIYQYSLSTAFDVSTASYDSESFSTSSQASDLTGIRFNNDGTKIYISDAGSDTIYQYSSAGSVLNDSTAYAMSLKVVQDSGASGYTVTWPTSVDWPNATAPTLTATASAVDQFVFYTYDGGTNWYGFTAGQALG